MKISFVVPYESYLNNRVFSNSDCATTPIHAGNQQWYEHYYKLYKLCNENNIIIGTHDVVKPQEADIVLFLDLPKKLSSFLKVKEVAPKATYILLLEESPLVNRHYYSITNHKYFHKIITYNTNLSGSKYIHYRLQTSRNFKNSHIPFKDRRTAVLINNNQYFKLKPRINFAREVLKRGWTYSFSSAYKYFFTKELYSLRRRVASCFETVNRSEFDIYGPGWDKFVCWRGLMNEPKLSLLGKYKFNIAFENCINDEGYISEKIFDALLSSTVPVYLGNKSISKIIPFNCYVDARNFQTINDLVNYLINCKEEEWSAYILAGEQFLRSNEFEKFTSDNYAETLVSCFMSAKAPNN